jgi:hypothetical protein
MEKQINEEIEDIETLELPKKSRNYVQTEKRKEAFEKARLTRLANIESKKKEKEELEKQKQLEVQGKIIKKAEQIKKKELKEKKVLEKYIEPEKSEYSDDEPEIVIRKIKKRPKKVIVLDEYSDDSEIIEKSRKPITRKVNRQVTSDINDFPHVIRFV